MSKSTGSRSSVTRALAPEQRYWQLWRTGRPDLGQFLGTLTNPTLADIASVLVVDQHERWMLGERPLAETYLSLLPAGGERDQAECDVVYSEYLIREQLGESPGLAEYQARFPALAQLLARQVDLHRALNETSAGANTAFGQERPLVPEARPSIPGYEIAEVIGRGGMGVVYRARQLSIGRDVALKVVRIGTGQDTSTLERMRREAQVTGQLSHPHIVTVHDAGLAGSWFYLAMEYVAGIDLHRLVEKRGAVSIAHGCVYLRQSALGLQHAFEQGLVHRDIKPSNLIVSFGSEVGQAGTLKILDLGLARAAPSGASTEAVTQVGTFMGTPDFVAPEQAIDPRLADVRSDLYSLGCTFAHVFTGVAPFSGATPLAKLMQHHHEEPPPLHELPPGLASIVHKLMAKSPADRYQTPAELVEALDAFEAGTASPIRTTRPSSLREPLAASLARRLTGPGDWVKCVAFSPDGAVLAAGSLDRTLRLWDALDGRELACCEAHTGGVLCLAFAFDRLLVTGGMDRTLCLWDIGDVSHLKLVWRASGHADNINAVCLLPDGDRLLSASHDGTIRVWDGKGRERAVWSGHTGPVWSVAVADDGKRAVSCGQDRTIRLWDVERGQARAVWDDQPTNVNCVAISPDGRLILSGGADGLLRVWDESGKVKTQIEAHASRLIALATSSDGQRILTGSRDQTARLCDLTGRTLAVLKEHTWWVTSVAMTSDGLLAATGSGDKSVCVWHLGGC